ncbi:MAG TPA: NAD(P)/FAD-dependent oxidoreductase [Puia sp.]|nr:NAD(P)/FAD-dependent oxidoreductase [Puia sp.]
MEPDDMPSRRTADTLIIGASLAGLACAAALQKRGIGYIIIEKEGQVAMPWRNHYERLHLHTNKRLSNLPFKKWGPMIPRYPDRQQVIDYIDDYRKEFAIEPVFNTEAIAIRKEGGDWMTETTNGSFGSKTLIMATGAYGQARPVRFNGLETFPGKVLHSCEYKTGAAFRGEKVLVVGFGNSACEIAIDLYEQGAAPVMAVRSAVNVIPRDILGVPVLELSMLLSPLSPRVADAISAPLIRWVIGDIRKLGLRRKAFGPLEQIAREGKPPVLDIGTIRHIRDGHIKIYGDIDRIEGEVVYFDDGRKEVFDAIVACIGYDRNYIGLIGSEGDGLYFCGYRISPTGQIREISSDAKRIAKAIAKADRPMGSERGADQRLAK